eukprot:gene29239-biopygen8543
MASSCSDNSCDLDAHIRALLKSDVKDIEDVLKRILQQRKEEDVCDVVLCPKVDVFRSAIRAQEGFLDELKGREQDNAAAIEKARLRIEVSTRVMNHLGTQLIDEQCRAKEKLEQLRDIQADRRKFADTVGKGKDELVALRRGDEEIRLEMNRIRHKTKLVVVEIRERSRVAASEIDVARVGLGDATALLVGARAEMVDANAELERTLLSVEETRHKVVHARADGSSLEDELAKLVDTRSELANTKSELVDTRSELANTKSELSGVMSELSDTKSELSGVMSELSDTTSELSGVMSEIDIVYSELKSVWDSKSELETTYSELKNEHGISKYELERARSELAHMNSMRAKMAPDQLKVVLKDVVNYDNRLTRANVLLASLYKELSDTESDIASTRIQIKAKRTLVLNSVISRLQAPHVVSTATIPHEYPGIVALFVRLYTPYTVPPNNAPILTDGFGRNNKFAAAKSNAYTMQTASQDCTARFTENRANWATGIGGHAVALKGLARPCCFCEIDSFACGVLSSQFPGIPIISDVTTLDPLDVIASSSRVGAALSPDLITASFPCQDVSMAGKGGGLSGTRSSLVWEVFRVLDGLPSVRAVFLENSPALRYRGLDAICEAFETRGFSVRYGILSAADMGARHVRSRIWVLAARDKDAGMLFPYLSRTRLSSSISQSLSYPFAKLDAEMPRLVTRSPGTESRADVRSLTLQWQALGNAIVPQAARFAFAVLLTEMRSVFGSSTSNITNMGRLLDVGLSQYPIVVRPCLESLDRAKAEFYTRLYYPGEDRLWRVSIWPTPMRSSSHFTPREWTAHGRRVKSGFATRVFHASETAASNGYVHGNHLDARERLRINIRWVETAIMGFPKGWMVVGAVAYKDMNAAAESSLSITPGHYASRNPLILEALAELDGKTINDVEKEVCCFVVGDQRCGDCMLVIVWPHVKDDFCTCKAACNTATAHDVPAPTLVYLARPCGLTDDMLVLEVVRESFVLKRFKNVGPNCGQVSRESMVRSTILALIQVTTNQIDEMDDVVPVKYKHDTLTYKKAVMYRELESYGGRPNGPQQHVASEMRKMGLIENSPKNAVTVFLVNLRRIRSAIYADEATKLLGTIRSDSAVTAIAAAPTAAPTATPTATDNVLDLGVFSSVDCCTALRWTFQKVAIKTVDVCSGSVDLVSINGVRKGGGIYFRNYTGFAEIVVTNIKSNYDSILVFVSLLLCPRLSSVFRSAPCSVVFESSTSVYYCLSAPAPFFTMEDILMIVQSGGIDAFTLDAGLICGSTLLVRSSDRTVRYLSSRNTCIEVS